MRASKTWIILANREKARILERVGLSDTASRIVTLNDVAKFGEKRTYEAPLGRVFDSHEMARHAMEPPRDRGDIERHRFAKTITRLLEAYATKQRFDHLVIIAEPSMLGVLRLEIGRRTAPLVTKEISKDLSGKTDDGVIEYLENASA